MAAYLLELWVSQPGRTSQDRHTWHLEADNLEDAKEKSRTRVAAVPLWTGDHICGQSITEIKIVQVTTVRQSDSWKPKTYGAHK